MLLRPFAEFEHLRKFVFGVDVQDRERHAAEERFPREPDQHVRIFPHRPRHTDVLERMIRLAKNENALVLEIVEMCPVRCHWAKSVSIQLSDYSRNELSRTLINTGPLGR